MVHFGEYFWSWRLRSYSVTRHVNLSWPKIGEKCHNWKSQMWHFWWFSYTVQWCALCWKIIGKVSFPNFLTKNSENFKNPFFGFLTAKILIILAILSQISFCFAHGEKKMRLFLGLVSCPNCIPYFSMQNMTRTELHSTYFPAVVRIIASQLLSLFHLLELPILLMF